MVQSFLLLLISPLLLAITAVVFALQDLIWLLSGRKIAEQPPASRHRSASVVIPNWNGRDLLERYLPSVLAALESDPENEIIVVDNGSQDGSVKFLQEAFPQVRVLALPHNLGFGGGSNAGFAIAKNDVVVLLNSDMRVHPGFLAPLLTPFSDSLVFAVSCQIFLSDPAKRREETGLTLGWWQDGSLKVSHKEDSKIAGPFPCFYGGGGSCAFDRRKFLQLGGFDELLTPFYLEDTDLGYLAWKRGWKVLYQPASMVWHEHRGTIGKKFSNETIQAALKKNYLLFCWKNIHEWGRFGPHLLLNYAGAILSLIFGDEPGRTNLRGWWRAFLQLRQALRSRWLARSLATISDTEAFRRTQAGYYYDRFTAPALVPQRPRVLFVSPYSIVPPVHGGAVFMYQTLRELSKHCDIRAIVLLDYPQEESANREALPEFCTSVEVLVRTPPEKLRFAASLPHAVGEFDIPQLRWLIHREIFTGHIDVVQLEYTPMAQYSEQYRRVVNALFEHDIYFQSIARALGSSPRGSVRWKAGFEYLRALRYELSILPGCDLVQVCTRENGRYLTSFLPELKSRIQDGLRAGVAAENYPFPGGPRDPLRLLFLGSFRHAPNQVALAWFVREILPLVLRFRPEVQLMVAGSDPPPQHNFPPAVRMLGFVEDVQPLLSQCAVFVCPILSGSGVRVKLLEAFASGIPVVSTFVGAEGLARETGNLCFLTDDPVDFADCILELLGDVDGAAEMAARARAEVVANWDIPVITARLVESYRAALRQKRS